MSAELPAYFLVGPTAVGKSAVAHCLAEQHGYTIVSADSMMVYRGMDIGTAKPSAEERRTFQYLGVDLADPDQPFSVARYIQCLMPELARLARGGRPALVVGGTGLYVQALLHGLDGAPAGDEALRAHWARRVEAEGLPCLQDELKRRDRNAFDALADTGNARRLIRALERLEQPAAGVGKRWAAAAERGMVVGLQMDPERLKRRIEIRTADMYRLGLVEEVRGLLKRFENLSTTASQAIGYAEAMAVIEGRCTQSEAAFRTEVRTRQLAKRQRTWFRHQARVEWVDAGEMSAVSAAAARVKEAWDKHGPTRIRIECAADAGE